MTNKRTRRTQVVRQLVCEEEQQMEGVKAHQLTEEGIGFAEAKKRLKEYSSNAKWNSIQRATREISFE